MGKSQKKSSGSKPAKDTRDPAEIRSEIFRVAAQRETVEAFVVAFILALLFRAFLAEAFVIPTGSMAPTLMGAHKDLVCDECGAPFQVGASRERSGSNTDDVVVAGICPNCRYVNPLDLVNDSNEKTFNGDRILVSKFTYTLNEPERWDVIVFKYPGNPKQNYIKRLVGLPNETLELRHGDVYASPTGSSEQSQILRKPAGKLLAMRQLVYDTDHQSEDLINANYPSRWQPWREKAEKPPTDSWEIERSADGMEAILKNGNPDRFEWLRYFHRWPTDAQWELAQSGGSLAHVDPYSSRAITDFYTYGSYVLVPASAVYGSRPSNAGGSFLSRMMNGGYSAGSFSPSYRSGESVEQFGNLPRWGGQDQSKQEIGRDGMDWVGDLMLEAHIETSNDSSEMMLELVEAGVKYRCRIDLLTGQATLEIDDIEPREFDPAEDGSVGVPTAKTSITNGGSHELRFSNCDDQLLLWVNDSVVEFDRPTTFDAREFRTDEEDHPMYLDDHPLDAAPAGLAVRGGDATVTSLRIHRDKYYIATSQSDFGIYDYDMNKLWQLTDGTVTRPSQIQKVLADPSKWDSFEGWGARRTIDFELAEDQFFPMGDNSPESLDARCWADTKTRQVHGEIDERHKTLTYREREIVHLEDGLPRGVNEDAWRWSEASYVPRDLLVGKALLVFWPHSWNSPIPLLPNFKRIKLIR